MGFVDTAASELIKKIFEWMGNPFKRKVDLSVLMTDSVDVHQIADDIIYNNGVGLTVDFFYLMNAFNGKKKNPEHRYKFRKIISGDHNFQVHNFNVKKWRKIPINAEYLDLLVKLNLYGHLSFTTSKMQSGDLKAKFDSWNLDYVRYYLIDGDVNGQMWYIIVGTAVGSEEDFNSAEHVHFINVAKAQILDIIGDLKK